MNSWRVSTIPFSEAFKVWDEHLWPDRESEIEDVSHIGFSGSYLPEVNPRDPVFFSIKDQGSIVAINSIHWTFSFGMRSRGLYVSPEYRGQGLGKTLLNESIFSARSKGARYLWTLPRIEALPVYESCGFMAIKSSEIEAMEYGPNYFCSLIL